MVEDKLSRLGLSIQTEWSLLPEFFFSQYPADGTNLRSIFCYQVQQKTTSVLCHQYRISWAVDSLSLPCEYLDTCLPIGSYLGQSGEAAGLPMQENHSDCPRVVQHALVLGSSGLVKQDPSVPSQSANTPFQSDSKSTKPKSSCLAPRASAIKKQGFSEAVAVQIEAP